MIADPETSLVGTLSEPETLVGMLTIPEVVSPDTYEGAYSVTPSEQEQVLQTEDLLMAGNLTIGAVPSNYGRLEYNGQYLRVY